MSETRLAEPPVAKPPFVVDADSHWCEHPDLFRRLAPPEYRDRVPHVEIVDGEKRWVMDGHPLGRASAGAVIARDRSKESSYHALFEWTIDDVHVGAYDPVERIGVLDECGIDAQVIFPSTIGLGGQDLGAVEDQALCRLAVEIYNDGMAEIQAESGNRLLPMPLMPAWDVDACVREAERAKGLGLRGVNITSDPQDQGAPDLANRAWDPLWEACSDLALPVHFHIGASLTTMTFFGNYPWASHDDDTKLAIGGTLLFVGNARVVVNVICSGMLDRYPELKIVSVESGAGWVPFILEALDYEMAENAPALRASLSLSPSEYFKRQIYATTWFERSDLPSIVAAVGEDNIMFETDFPHPTCLYPDPLKTAEQNMRDLSPAARRKILGDNAAKLYGL
ncbi:MAG: amidohydrolase [Actinobacteria bacterium]|nr:amidohydrolase [Actinomycetota bacterium]